MPAPGARPAHAVRVQPRATARCRRRNWRAASTCRARRCSACWRTLETMGFLERADGGRDYRLGMAVLRLGFEYLASLELTELGPPLLSRLRDELHYPVQPGGARRPLDRLRGQGRAVHALHQLGQRGHAPAGACHRAGPRAAGRPLAGRSCASSIRKTSWQVYSPSTPHTVDRAVRDGPGRPPARLCAATKASSKRSISTIAAPVRDHTGHVVAALGATIPRGHIDEGRMDEMVQRVRHTRRRNVAAAELRAAPPAASVVTLRSGDLEPELRMSTPATQLLRRRTGRPRGRGHRRLLRHRPGDRRTAARQRRRRGAVRPRRRAPRPAPVAGLRATLPRGAASSPAPATCSTPASVQRLRRRQRSRAGPGLDAGQQRRAGPRLHLRRHRRQGLER